jgi:hypothetical protein
LAGRLNDRHPSVRAMENESPGIRGIPGTPGSTIFARKSLPEMHFVLDTLFICLGDVSFSGYFRRHFMRNSEGGNEREVRLRLVGPGKLSLRCDAFCTSPMVRWRYRGRVILSCLSLSVCHWSAPARAVTRNQSSMGKDPRAPRASGSLAICHTTYTTYCTSSSTYSSRQETTCLVVVTLNTLGCNTGH